MSDKTPILFTLRFSFPIATFKNKIFISDSQWLTVFQYLQHVDGKSFHSMTAKSERYWCLDLDHSSKSYYNKAKHKYLVF